MDPLTWLLDHAIAGKYGSVATLIVIAVIVSRGLTKLEGHGRDLVAAVKGLGERVDKTREEDKSEHAITRESIVRVERRVETAEAALTKVVATDGEVTRTALNDKRFSDLRDAVQEAAGSPPAEPEPPPYQKQRSRTGNQPAVR